MQRTRETLIAFAMILGGFIGALIIAFRGRK